MGNGASYGNTEKRFTIAFSTSQAPARLGKLSSQECVVKYSQMSKILQNIQKTGGKIISISEVA
ncbi:MULTISPECIES: phycobilisome linker polypeptide [unclassified Okeania]|uniref:phycobilisome linker polypeptide n=1 Tax=unclassified Okeania TaxID=2634635 RepID=UPI00338E29EC